MSFSKEDIIIDFINTFSGVNAKVIDNPYYKAGAKSQFILDSSVVNCFTNGCCYWFAAILKERFNGQIVYEPSIKHFACMIDDIPYDILGNCNKTYPEGIFHWVLWDTYELDSNKMPTEFRQEVIDKCIKKYNDELNKDYINNGGELI